MGMVACSHPEPLTEFPMWYMGTIIDPDTFQIWESKSVDLKACDSLCNCRGPADDSTAGTKTVQIAYVFITYNLLNTVMYTGIRTAVPYAWISDEQG